MALLLHSNNKRLLCRGVLIWACGASVCTYSVITGRKHVQRVGRGIDGSGYNATGGWGKIIASFPFSILSRTLILSVFMIEGGVVRIIYVFVLLFIYEGHWVVHIERDNVKQKKWRMEEGEYRSVSLINSKSPFPPNLQGSCAGVVFVSHRTQR